jgi:internalin A
MYWNAGFESVFGCGSLESLFVFSQPDADLSRYGELGALRRLELSQGRKLLSTRGVGELDFLGLYHQGALAELAGLPDLRVLSLQTCKRIETLDGVAGCTSLTQLDVANCGDIASLAPLTGLRELERLGAWESTRVLDGDLSVLLTLPRLRELRMADRRGYRPGVSEIEAVLPRH